MVDVDALTLFDKHITGHMEHPRVQQQQRQPQKSHRTLTGKDLRKVTLIRVMVALNSSGATRACRAGGNSVSKRLDSPNLQFKSSFYSPMLRMINLHCDIAGPSDNDGIWNQVGGGATVGVFQKRGGGRGRGRGPGRSHDVQRVVLVDRVKVGHGSK